MGFSIFKGLLNIQPLPQSNFELPLHTQKDYLLEVVSHFHILPSSQPPATTKSPISTDLPNEAIDINGIILHVLYFLVFLLGIIVLTFLCVVAC